MYALYFLYALIDGNDTTASCITTALGNTSNILSKFSKKVELQVQISNPRIRAIGGTNKWPSAEDVRKIAGLNFIISVGRKSSFSMKISKELSNLVEMLREKPVRR